MTLYILLHWAPAIDDIDDLPVRLTVDDCVQRYGEDLLNLLKILNDVF